MKIRLYSGPLSMFGAKAHIAALEKGLDVDLIMVPFNADDRYEPKHAEVVRINPKQQVPVLVHGDLELFDSTQIFEYLEELSPQPALWPGDIKSRARARLLEHLSDEVYFPQVVQLMIYEEQPENPAFEAALNAAAAYYQQMEALIDGQDYLLGNYSFADIAFFMAQVFGERKGALLTGATPDLLAWRDRMTARPAVAEGVSALVSHLASKGRPVPEFLN
ncbi:MAG TPA: glutathione S-transferase family protein [Xanthomonadales bacterium]|nr:glutathione S-transferase family protein [Xanthomonadales bacterium]